MQHKLVLIWTCDTTRHHASARKDFGGNASRRQYLQNIKPSQYANYTLEPRAKIRASVDRVYEFHQFTDDGVYKRCKSFSARKNECYPQLHTAILEDSCRLSQRRQFEFFFRREFTFRSFLFTNGDFTVKWINNILYLDTFVDKDIHKHTHALKYR